jgi:hypothetical protein
VVLEFELRTSNLLDKSSTTWATPPAFFYDGYFQDKILQTICPWWLRTTILLISASYVARIMRHQHPTVFPFKALLDFQRSTQYFLNVSWPGFSVCFALFLWSCLYIITILSNYLVKLLSCHALLLNPVLILKHIIFIFVSYKYHHETPLYTWFIPIKYF